jgi:uncharacterized GH25 family protein
MVLRPSRMTAPKGESLLIELHNTHRFIVAEEVDDVDFLTAGVFRNGAWEEAEVRGNEAELRNDFDVTIEDDGAILVVVNRYVIPWSVTNEGGMRGARSELEARYLRVLRSSKSDKFAKAIVNATKDDENFAVVVGQELEIVPITNPADAVVGEFFDVRILYNGEPVPFPVWATYEGFVLELDDTYAYYTIADTGGLARIKITAPGPWFVRTETDEDGVEGEYDSRNLASVLTFEVK